MRRLTYLLTIALLAVAAGVSTSSSSASFSARSTNAASFSGKTDWAPPTVSLVDPGGVVQGMTPIVASAADDRSAITSVTIEYAIADTGAWMPMCTDTTAPFSCNWNTVAISDGFYDLRATATDGAGYTAVSAIVTTRVVNTASVVLTDPGDNLRGFVPLHAVLYNAPASTNLVIQFKRSAASSWTTIPGCSTTLFTTIDCTWDTRALTDVYDIQAKAVVLLSTYTDAAVDIQVDNTAPTVTMTSTGSPLSGSTTLSSTADDPDSGVAQVAYSVAPSGSSTWTSLCSATVSPYRCSFNTSTLTDGSYSFRAIATDVAGNVSAPSVVANIVVNNTIASVSLTNPGTLVNGTVVLGASAISSQGISSIRIQRAVSGSTTFTDICTDTTSPYTCAWNTTAVIDGSYDLRAVMTQGNGAILISGVVTVQVDNTPFKGSDVQTVNGGATTGKLQAGDKISLTYTTTAAPASLLSGWDGTPKAVTARFLDGRLVGGLASDDQFSVDGVNLGTVKLKGNFIRKNKNVAIAASMSLTNQTVAGVTRSVVTVTLTGTPAAGDIMSTATKAAAMIWTPSAAAKDSTGNPCSTAAVTESGSLDKDF